jgi:hypothetical protein
MDGSKIESKKIGFGQTLMKAAMNLQVYLKINFNTILSPRSSK